MKFVSLLSSGIDSPVACYAVSGFVDSFIFVHADNRPFTDKDEIDNTFKIAKKLDEIIDVPISLYVISHGEMLNKIMESIHPRFTCVLCKRMMVRYAEKICFNDEADAVVMGDSLGQVASQTLQNIRVVDDAIDMPIVRPLIGWDKEEIVDCAKEIGTFDLSILPSMGCSAVPNKPATKAKLEVINEIEQDLSFKSIVTDLVEHAKVFSSDNFDSFNDV